MFIFISAISTLVAALCWLLWAFGQAGEHPGRVLWIAIVATILALSCAAVGVYVKEELL